MDGSEKLSFSLSSKLLCHVCLTIGMQLFELSEEKDLNFYMTALNEIQITNTMEVPQICSNCLNTLHAAISFKEQVKSSYKVLQMYNVENGKHSIGNEISSVQLEPSKVDEIDENQDGVKLENEIKWVDEKEECKEEDSDDLFFDVPLCDDIDIGDEQTKWKTKRKKDSSISTEPKKLKKHKTKSEKLKKKLYKKITEVYLSYEEMMKDKDDQMGKDSFKVLEFKCYDCCIGFKSQKMLEKHLEGKHSEKIGNYRCPICKTVHASVDAFTTHYKRHNRRFLCNICDKKTVDMKAMENHFVVRHNLPSREYKCDLCGKTFDSPNSHRYHMDTHKGRLKCRQCDKTFMHRSALKNHKFSVHDLNNKFPCEICNKNFRWKTSLIRHIKELHSGAKSTPVAYCELCNVSFTMYSNYQRHMNTSLKHVSKDQLRLICDHCNRRFSNKTKLRDHIEEKHLHKTFTCSLCNKVSKNRVALDQHIRNVHKRRPKNKICHHCGKGFPTKSQLESHIRSHTGERPFSCQYCPSTFSQHSNLYKHNRQVHLNLKPKKYPVNKKKDDKMAEMLEASAPIAFGFYTEDMTENIII